MENTVCATCLRADCPSDIWCFRARFSKDWVTALHARHDAQAGHTISTSIFMWLLRPMPNV